MTTTDVTASPILALDLGKYKSVACVYDRGTAQASFDTITTSRAELLRLIERHRPGVVVIEVCALAGWVHDLCTDRGLPCKVANTASASGWCAIPGFGRLAGIGGSGPARSGQR
jgi:transposase